jgi:hypothetical protein
MGRPSGYGNTLAHWKKRLKVLAFLFGQAMIAQHFHAAHGGHGKGTSDF